MATITKITSESQLSNLLTEKTEPVCLHFTVDDSSDERTKQVLSKLSATVATLAEKYPTVIFCTVDLPSNEELAEKYHISALSTFKIYQNQKILYKFMSIEEEEIVEHLEAVVNDATLAVKSCFDKSKYDNLLKDNKFVVVDYTAMWCGPCRMIGPQFEKIAKKQLEDGKNLLDGGDLICFVKVDADDNKEIIKDANVECYPTFKFFKDGQECDKLEGASADELKLKIKKMLDPEYVEVHYAEFVATKEAFDKVVKEKEIVIVDFTASWCPPCQFIKPIFEEMAAEQKDNEKIKFIKIDVDENDETAQACNVKSMPTFHVYVDGEKSQEFSGASEEKLRSAVAAALEGKVSS